jgi:serine protease inhibitor
MQHFSVVLVYKDKNNQPRCVMKKAAALFLSMALITACMGCTARPDTPSGPLMPTAQADTPDTSPQVKAAVLPAPAETVDPAVVDGVNAMGIDMLQRLYSDMDGENFMVSPASISLALSMTMNGAEGETLTQMKDAMHFTGMDTDTVNEAQKDLMSILLNPDGTDKVKVEIADVLWVEDNFILADTFRETCQSYYNAGVRTLDFADPASLDIINGWVDENTHGMIETILDEPIDPDTVLFLMNTLFFDGKWSVPFDPEKTYDGIFTKADGSRVPAMMMPISEDLMTYVDPEGNIDCFGKPFGDSGRLEMLFIRDKQGLDAFLRDFSLEQLNEMVHKSYDAELIVDIPRFSYDTSLCLNDVLTAMGMKDAFGGAARFGLMSDTGEEDLFISKVLHKTRIEVKEEGAKAAAVTSVDIARSAGPPVQIVLDSPFLYLIRDTMTGAVLFMGTVEEPVES